MLATESGKTANQVSETIITELINKQIIEDISDNWGFPVADCYERDVTVVEMVDVIRAIGISPVRSVHLDALLECVLIGDDDCPECGGEMEVTDGEYRRTGGDGYLTPPEYSPIWEEKRAAIADTKRATNQVINKKNLSYGIEIKSKRSNRPFRGERKKGIEKGYCSPFI